MSSFQKIPKDEWLKLSPPEQDFHNKAFQESVEKRRVSTIYVTRFIAVLCVCALIWIGFVQFSAIHTYDKTISQYGSLGYCYLCGEQTLKQCSCQYSFLQGNKSTDISFLANKTAYENAQPCKDLNLNDNRIALPNNLSFH